jgi:hypothetical protein
LTRSLGTNSSLLGDACSFSRNHDLIACVDNLLNPTAYSLCPHLRARKEGGEEFPDRGFSEDESDRDQDPDPCRERADASEQARSAATGNASDAAAVGWEDDLNERKQPHKGKERQGDA